MNFFASRISVCLLRATAACVLGAAAASTPAATDAFGTVMAAPASAGLGAAVRAERSAYRGGGTRYDLLPLYLYEGERVFLHASRAGIKLDQSGNERLDLFVEQRFEGFPVDRIPAALSGMAAKDSRFDIGIAYRYSQPWGTLHVEMLHDVGDTSKGTELRVGVSQGWSSGRLSVRPNASLAWRNARLNNYYYGVDAAEARVGRPAYQPGAGVNLELGVNAAYELSAGWRVLAGASATLADQGVRRSPIVQSGPVASIHAGLAYDFGSIRRAPDAAATPTYLRAMYGRAATQDCRFIQITTLRCTSIDHLTPTSIGAIQVGKPFIEGFKGLPLDFVGYLGLAYHDEHGLQRNALQVDAFMKAFYYGFPWSDRVKTRLGLGVGVSYAERAPYTEKSEAAKRDRVTSHLLNYLDPSVDVSAGDLLGVRRWKETYVGVGVSHRSGIFGTSRLLGNAKGGSNYVYTYIETSM